MALIDLDNEFLELFYSVTGGNVPDEIDLSTLKKQLTKIVSTLNEVNKNTKTLKPQSLDFSDDTINAPSGPAILIIDDLGVITYQLKVLLSQFKLDIDCSQEIYDAVNKYKKRQYSYVIMDLFIPTEREGFILLTELKKMSASYGMNTIVGVITASPRKEIEQQCKARGANFFLEKNNDWQNQLIKIMDNYINEGKDPDDW